MTDPKRTITMMADEERHRETCPSCRASGYGNATCRVCIAQWPRFGISQETVDKLLAAIGDRPASPPMGTVFQ